MSRRPEWGNRGGRPAAMDCAASVMEVSGPGHRTRGDPRHERPDQQRHQRGEGHRQLGAMHDRVNLLQVGRDADDAGPAGDGHVDEIAPDRLAPSLRDAGGVGRGPPGPRAGAVVLERRQRQRGIVAFRRHGAVRGDQRDPVAGLLGEPVDPGLRQRRIGRQPLADDLCLPQQRRGDLLLEVPPERDVRRPEQHDDADDEHEQRPRDDPAGEAHAGRPARSFARNR